MGAHTGTHRRTQAQRAGHSSSQLPATPGKQAPRMQWRHPCGMLMPPPSLSFPSRCLVRPHPPPLKHFLYLTQQSCNTVHTRLSFTLLSAGSLTHCAVLCCHQHVATTPHTPRAGTPVSCLVGSGSVWRSRAPWRPAPSCCCLTSRLVRWTLLCASSCARGSRRLCAAWGSPRWVWGGGCLFEREGFCAWADEGGMCKGGRGGYE